jgi:hypothetical protein
MKISSKLHRSMKSAFVIGSVFASALTLGIAATPAQAQIDNGTVPVAGTWSRGARETVAWVDTTNWKLVTELTGGPFSSRRQAGVWAPVAGDWDGDGVDSVRMFHLLNWSVVPLERGPLPGPEDPHPCPWEPLVMDQNGDGIDEISVYDHRDGRLHGLEEGPSRFEGYEPAADLAYPVAGDWDGDRVDTLAIVRQQGSASDWAVLAGDWDGDGLDTQASLHLETGELVVPEIEVEALQSVTGGASRADLQNGDLSGIFAPNGGGLGGGCFKIIGKKQESVISFSCMTIVITNWKESFCCPISPTSFSCSTTLKGSTKTYGGVC